MQRCRRLGTYAGVYVLMTAVPTIRWNEALDREQQAPRRSTFREGVYRIESNQGNEEVHTKPSSSSPAVPFNLPAHYHPPHHPQPRFTRASRPPPGHGPAAGSCTCPGAWAAAPASGPSSRAPPPPPRPHTAPVAVDLGVGESARAQDRRSSAIQSPEMVLTLTHSLLVSGAPSRLTGVKTGSYVCCEIHSIGRSPNHPSNHSTHPPNTHTHLRTEGSPAPAGGRACTTSHESRSASNID